MEVKLNWTVLTDRMYTVAPTGKSREQLYALLFNRAGSKRMSMKRKHTAVLTTEKYRYGGSNAKRGCSITNANVRHG